MVEEKKRAFFFGQNEAGGQGKLAIGWRLTVRRRPTAMCDPQPFLKKKPGLKQANTSMSVPPLASYKWAIKQEE